MSLCNDDLAQLASDLASELGIAGAQISVAHRGEVAEGAAGITDVRTGEPVTTETLFQVGSTTKVFTAAVLMGLVEEGRIGLDVPVVKQLPGFELADQRALAVITPRQLLSMSSGIDNGPYTDFGSGDDALARYVDSLTDIPQTFAPGEGYGYSNAATCIAGRLVEHVTGQTWDDALRVRLLEPTGLRDSASLEEEILQRRFAVGHTVSTDGALQVRERWSHGRSIGPAGGTFCSTATDLVRFGHLFLHDGVSLEGQQVLAAEAVRAMQRREVEVPPTLVAEWWGLGPYGKTWDGVDVAGHSGTNIGGSSYLLWAVGRDIAVATTVNTPKLGYPFAARVFRELFPLAGITVPGEPEAPPHVEVDGARLAGTYRMQGLTLTVTPNNGALAIAGAGDGHVADSEIAPSTLIPLSPTVFLPTDPAIDGRRGWALAFLGSDFEAPTHLVNGLFTLRRAAS
jgi:CubicO group peptidase (beta-lactamase class C family)